MTNSLEINTVTRRVITSMRTRSRMTTSRGMADMTRMVAMGTATMHTGSSSIMTATIRNDKTTTTCGDWTHRIAIAWAVLRYTHDLGSLSMCAAGDRSAV